MAESRSWTKSLFVGTWNVLNFSRKLFFNIIFIAIAVFIIIALSSDNDKLSVTPDSMLKIDFKGRLVIEEQEVDPFDKFMQEALEQEDDNPEMLVRDLVFALENAAQDNRIKGLVLNLQALMPSGLDKLRTVAEAIDSFKASGKPVYAVGDYYSRDQYYLAAHADKIVLNPMGAVLIDGYGRYGVYMKDFLDKLKVTANIFRVGTYKSAIEPFIRNDMSEAAKEANKAWLDKYWEQYKADVMTARGFDEAQFDEKLSSLIEKFKAVGGDFSDYALEYGWVDELKSREQVREMMLEHVEEADNRSGYKLTSYNTYMKIINPNLPVVETSDAKIAVVVASGTILNGNQKAGAIGGDSTARLLRKARKDDSVKAVVLHVDSPGGSAFASEVIRQEVLNLKAAGKPVVAKMGTYAASGGYWISASSDYIVASPSTITGSIGVFGLFMTYEKSLNYLGINSDGVGSTELADLSPARGMSEGYKDLFQLNVENLYGEFINLVATERNLSVDTVDGIAQGRVWIGETALELGLVDELGTLDSAVAKAAELASIDNYDISYVKRSLSPQELFWKEFFGQALASTASAGLSHVQSPLLDAIKHAVNHFDELYRLNDPQGVYIYCLQCKMH
ncbi:signal peptide peptidase SppA [Alteromonas sediminis]|uniref:Signal peptide peptidase SppA n=1 Tax=Alteromonas sediminis TaxID=2259342 RepID=A0A3N5Y624_9ALTE|nr:signal peptide peptidase SppA [Alteromonas sediminis]RPJ68743.1 signal peptide peptidase SppA [Alteromonas sediminis]